MATAKKAGTPVRRQAGARGPARPPGQGPGGKGRPAQPAARKPARRTDSAAARAGATERAQPAELDAAFRLLKAVLERHVHSLQVLFNTPENYTLVTRRLDPKGQPREFAVLLKLKTHVSFKLAPLAQFPELAVALPAELKACLQGKATLSFARAEPELAPALDTLARNALARLRSAGQA
jgi:hypothetical protein